MPVIDDVRAALTDQWSSAREVYERMGRWSPVTVRTTLVALADAGEADKRIEPTQLHAYQYRRPRRVMVNGHPCG